MDKSVYVNVRTGAVGKRLRSHNRLPDWATPERRQRLVELFKRNRGFSVFGHSMCQVEEHHYEVFIEGLIEDWRAEDSQERAALWRMEERRIHHGEKGRFGSQFDPVQRDVFMETRPEYYLVGLGVSAPPSSGWR